MIDDIKWIFTALCWITSDDYNDFNDSYDLDDSYDLCPWWFINDCLQLCTGLKIHLLKNIIRLCAGRKYYFPKIILYSFALDDFYDLDDIKSFKMIVSSSALDEKLYSTNYSSQTYSLQLCAELKIHQLNKWIKQIVFSSALDEAAAALTRMRSEPAVQQPDTGR